MMLKKSNFDSQHIIFKQSNYRDESFHFII